MSNADSSNSSAVSVVAILAILVLVGLVLYFVISSPTESGELELEVNVDTIGQLRMERPRPILGDAATAATFGYARS